MSLSEDCAAGARPVPKKACKSSVKQSVQVQCQTKRASPVSNKARKSSVKQSMQVQCETKRASPVSNKACNKVRGLCLTLPRGLGWLLLLPLCRAWRARVRDSTAESRRHLALLMPVGLTRWKGPSVKGLLPSPGPAR